MAGGHSHRRGDDLDASVARVPRIVLLVALAVVGVASVAGLVVLWPGSSQVDKATSGVEFAAPGVTFPRAEITDVSTSCGAEGSTSADTTGSDACWTLTVRLTSGAATGKQVDVQVVGPTTTAGLHTGDSIQLMRIPGQQGQPASYTVFGIDRGQPVGLLAGVFVIVVVLVARLRGALALVGLLFSGLVVVKFLLPALLVSDAGVAVALVAASVIMFVVLYLAHGPSIRTSTALAGTLCGIAITALVASYSVGSSHLSGIGDESGALLSSMVSDLDFHALLVSAIIIAGLGVLNDVTITQASSVWELRAAGPELTRLEVFRSAMRIGRDHIASTIYTIVFAYAGAALSVVLLIYLYDRPLLDLLGTEDIATEVVRTLCSAIGLVLAVPITTAIATATVAGPRPSGPPSLTSTAA